MNTKEAKNFLVQQVAESAALEHVPLSDLEKRMLYFVENDPASCDNPLELNEEFEAQYDTQEYETKIARLLSHAYKRLKADDPQKVVYWNDAMYTISVGDHYLPVMWHGSIPTENSEPDSGRNVVRCGSVALAVFAVMAALINAKIPSWIEPSLGMLLFFLCMLTMFFLAQQGYRALRRSFRKKPN
jgi:hypothetical protein